jgi:glycosyltransferase involved in cell wall biosynthesis
MNVLSIIHYPIFGGPHNCNSMVAPYLADMGISLTVVVPDEPGNAVELLQGRNVSTMPIPLTRMRATKDIRVHARNIACLPGNVRSIRRIIRSESIDVVLINGLVNPHAAFAARLENVPVVWQLIDTFPPMMLRRAMMPLVLRLSGAIMSTGMAVAAVHPGALSFGDRLISFFPIVDSNRFRPDPKQRATARRELGLHDSDFVVGNVGNINPMKGHRTFIKAAAALKRRHASTRFVILGASSVAHADYRAELSSEAESLGLSVGDDLIVHDPGTRVHELAPALDLFWLTSEPRSEGIPTVIGEAMALEMPVVAANVGAVSAAVADGLTGILVAPRDVEAFVAVTSELLDDPDRRRDMGNNARQSAQQLFSPEACADLHRTAFEVALASQSQAEMET